MSRKPRVAWGMCAYGEVQHPTISTLTNMAFHTGRASDCDWGWIAAWDVLLCGAREGCIEAAIKSDFDYILFLDSDMTFPHDAAIKLLRNSIDNDRPIVSGFYAQRKPPHLPLIYKRNDQDGVRKYSQYQPAQYTGSIECDATGLGCCLIRLDALDKITKPWFQMESGNDKGGSAFSEDVHFFSKIREAGIPVFVDTTVCCGHMTEPAVVVPGRAAPCPEMPGATHVYADEWREKNMTEENYG